MQNNQITLVACPTCQTKTPWTKNNLDRPFCSARCKLIDLGAWASETYSIPQHTTEEDDIFSDDLNVDPHKSFL